MSIGEKRQRKKKKLYDDEEVSLSDLIPKKRKRKVSDPSGLKGDRQLDMAGETAVKAEVKCGVAFISYAPFEKGGAYCIAPVGRSVRLSVGMSVSLNLVQLITQERFAQEASNLVGR